MEYLQSVLENTQIPVLSAFLLGLMTAISPCPLATNITAIGFISQDVSNRRKVFVSGLFYTLGRVFSYTGVGAIFFFGASQFKLSGFLQQYGEKILGPLLLVVGLFMLGIFSFTIPGLGNLSEKLGNKGKNSFWGALLLGIVFALAFCPYSGVLYFGMLIPMTIGSTGGLLLPIIFAVATGIPVIIFAWLIAFSVGAIGGVYNKVKVFEKWFRKIIAVVFLLIGVYYIAIVYIL